MKKYLCLIIVSMLFLVQGCGQNDVLTTEKSDVQKSASTPAQKAKKEDVNNSSKEAIKEKKTSENAKGTPEDENKETEDVTKEEKAVINKEAAEEQTYAQESTAEANEGEIKIIPLESVEGITSKQAEELCYEVMGEKDPETGFILGYAVTGAIEKGSKQYYTVRATWLVDNNHMSYIGDLFVSADGNEVYDGVVLGDGFEITKLVWSK